MQNTLETSKLFSLPRLISIPWSLNADLILHCIDRMKTNASSLIYYYYCYDSNESRVICWNAGITNYKLHMWLQITFVITNSGGTALLFCKISHLKHYAWIQSLFPAFHGFAKKSVNPKPNTLQVATTL